MKALGYPKDSVILSFSDVVKFYLWVLPFQFARMVGWVALSILTGKESVPESRFYKDEEARVVYEEVKSV
jgi:hypothetical protein